MIRRQLDWVAEQEARKAHNLKWEGKMLGPPMANRPRQEGGTESRWNEHEPTSKEIGEANRLHQKTGGRIDLFGDDFPGIDGPSGGSSGRFSSRGFRPLSPSTRSRASPARP